MPAKRTKQNVKNKMDQSGEIRQETAAQQEDCGCHRKHTPRPKEEQRKLQNRLNRMIGQMNGISRMLEENRYCGDILIQVAAVESALQNFGYEILQEHLETCVVEEVKQDHTQVMEEVLQLVRKLK